LEWFKIFGFASIPGQPAKPFLPKTVFYQRFEGFRKPLNLFYFWSTSNPNLFAGGRDDMRCLRTGKAYEQKR
jgi:hypothetical protein